MLKKSIGQAFQIIFKNSAVVEIAILCFIVMQFLSIFMKSRVMINQIAVLIYALSTSLLSVAFMAGFFNAVKNAVDNFPRVKNTEPSYAVTISKYNIDTFKSFFPGVSEYFWSVLGCSVLFNILFFALFAGGYFVGLKFLPDLNLDLKTLNTLIHSKTLMEAYVTANIHTLVYWLGYYTLLTYAFCFILMFWTPTVFCKTKNPITSVFYELKFLFKNFFSAVGLFFFLLASFIILNTLSVIFGKIMLISLIFVFILFYFMVFAVVLGFVFYRNIELKEKIEEVNSQDVFIKSSENENDKNEQ